jgi:hypothetical protein
MIVEQGNLNEQDLESGCYCSASRGRRDLCDCPILNHATSGCSAGGEQG